MCLNLPSREDENQLTFYKVRCFKKFFYSVDSMFYKFLSLSKYSFTNSSQNGEKIP